MTINKQTLIQFRLQTHKCILVWRSDGEELSITNRCVTDSNGEPDKAKHDSTDPLTER